MNDWLHNLTIILMTFVLFDDVCRFRLHILAAGTFGLVETLANGERGHARRESSGATRDIDDNTVQMRL